MAQRALIDTTVLYAAYDRSDDHHEASKAIVLGADEGRLPVMVVTDAVLLETMNGLNRKVGHAKAVDLLDRLEGSAGFQLVREPDVVWRRGIDVFREVPGISLGDAVIAASAERHGIGYIYSFDDGFDRVAWVSRLDAAESPFAP